MNICILVRAFEEGHGGVITHTLGLSKALKRKGHNLYILTGRLNGIISQLPPNIHIYKCKSVTGRYLWRQALSYGINGARSLPILHRKHKFDLIIGQGVSNLPAVWSKLDVNNICRTAYIWAARFFYLEGGFRLKPRKLLRNMLSLYPQVKLDQIACTHADKLTALCEDTKLELMNLYKIPKEEISIIPNAVDLSEFKDLKGKNIRAQYDLTDEPLALFLGRFVERKGFNDLIRAIPLVIKEVPDAKFMFVGGKPNQVTLQLIRREGVEESVIFPGYVPHNKVMHYYDACDVFVFPSLFEGMPFSVLEAMASSKPVIATALYGMKEQIVDGVTGFLIKPKDIHKLADRLIVLLSNRQLTQKLGRAARERVKKHFTWDIVADAFLKLAGASR